MIDSLSMSGYGRFVWSTFIISFVVLVAAVALYKNHFNRTRSRVARQVHARAGARS